MGREIVSDPMERIAAALERISPAPLRRRISTVRMRLFGMSRLTGLIRLRNVNRVDLESAGGHRSLARYAAGEYPPVCPWACLPTMRFLWGARGMGKSSLVKAAHAAVLAEGLNLKIVEVQREDLPSVGVC